MSNFFQSEMVRGDIQEMMELQRYCFQAAHAFPVLSHEKKLEYFNILEELQTQELHALQRYEPKKYKQEIAGKTAAELGGEPILFMRHFQRHGEFPDHLIKQITRIS